jgi:hypothetical protein
MTSALSSLIPASQPKGSPGSQPGFMDIARLDGEDGLVTVISQRSKDGAITFAMFREFDRQGARDRTSFVQAEMVQKYIDHATKTKAALEDINVTWAVNGTKLPFPPGGRGRPDRARDRSQSESDRHRGRGRR